MNKTIIALVNESRNQRLSLVPDLSDEGISEIWNAVSETVASNLKMRKATLIPNIGTFTFITNKIDVGQKKFLMVQRPVFILSEKLCNIHSIQQPSYPTTGEHSVMHLNFASISLDLPYRRDCIELCVKEVAQTFSRAIQRNTNIKFFFKGIGVLQIKNRKLKMKFFRELLDDLDKTGQIANCMEQRPGTADSVMSHLSSLSALERPLTSTFCLPKMNGIFGSVLPPIKEQEATEQPSTILRPISPDSRQSIKPHSVTNFDFDALSCHSNEKEVEEVHEVTSIDEPIKPSSPITKSSKHSRPTTAPHSLVSSPKIRISTSLPRPRDSLAPILPKCASPVCHNRSGQELCYLCMQRASRNVAVTFSQERKRKEMEQGALLQQYQQMKDTDAILREKEKENETRQLNRKIAAYNLGIAEGKREEKLKRFSDFEKSFMLQDRPLTPSQKYNQLEYGKALETQVKIRNAKQTRQLHDKKFQEKLEQTQLSEELAIQREQFLRAKAQQVSQYQKALDAQLKRKSLPIPSMEPDSKEPIFGKHDATNQKLLEKKQRAKETLKFQQEMAAEKKKKSIMEHLNRIKEESEVLKRTKKELIADRADHHERNLSLRKSLEETWKQHHDRKLKRLRDERQALNTPGLLLLQQTENYKRCGQCQRKTHNQGETNIWKESRYIPGSRLLI